MTEGEAKDGAAYSPLSSASSAPFTGAGHSVSFDGGGGGGRRRSGSFGWETCSPFPRFHSILCRSVTRLVDRADGLSVGLS